MKNLMADAFDGFLIGVGTRDRVNVERHLAALDESAAPGHADVWRRLAARLRELAPRPVKTVGQHVVQFFVADGPYQMQVFSLEDRRDGTLVLYLPDVLDAAVADGILVAPLGRGGEPAPASDDAPHIVVYPIAGGAGEMIGVEALTPANSPAPPHHMKHMLGWNRKALRVTIPAVPGPEVEAVEALCALAARTWRVG